MKKSISAILGSYLVYLATGCVASPKPELVAELDALAKTPAKKTMAPDLSSYTAQPIKAGQWTHYLMVDKSGKSTSYRQQVLAQGDEPGSFWFETEIITPESKSVARSLAYVDDQVRLNNKTGKYAFTIDQFVHIKRLINWHAGETKATELPPQAVQLISGAIGKVSFLSNSRMNGVETANVKAGSFKRCFRMTSQAQTSFFSSSVTGCVHPSVPLSSLVNAVDSEGTRWELMGYGLDAKESFIRVPIQTAGF